MFGSENVQTVVVSLDYDPEADKSFVIWRAPRDCEIKEAWACVVDDVAASTANYFSLTLLDGGANASGTAAMTNAIGGTAGWTGGTPKNFTISEGTLDENDYLVLKYDETGTATFKQVTVGFEYVLGVGA